MRNEADGFDADNVVTEKAAGALLLARKGSDGLPEFLMMQRPLSHRFGAGQFVFPGGKVETVDGEADALTRSARHAALRETEEEMGISIKAPNAPLIFRWITPRGVPIRFDARFFLAVCEEEISPEPSSQEVDSWQWIGAQKALDAFAANHMPMMFPTVRSMELLALLPTIETLLDFAHRNEAPPIEPRVHNGEDGVEIKLPAVWESMVSLAKDVAAESMQSS